MCNCKKTLELAGALIIDDNKLLLIHRNTKNRIQWELPGGKLEKNETPEKAVARELLEELNVNVTIEKYLGCKESIEDDIVLKYHWYKCNLSSRNETVKLMEDKFDKFQYFTKEDINNCKELSSNMEILKDFIDIENI